LSVHLFLNEVVIIEIALIRKLKVYFCLVFSCLRL